MIDWIQGDKFESVGDLIFAPDVRSNGDHSRLENTFTPTECMKFKPCIVYTHTFYVKQLFSVIKNIDNFFIVVTHNCDTNVDFSPPPNVVKWFSQNVISYDDRIEPIPIGLENDRWFRGIHKKEKMCEKLKQSRNYRNLVYMNFNISTNPDKRKIVFDTFRDKSWVTSDIHNNGEHFDDYLDNIYNHKFVLCPEGNGIDTHRLWETLYMGSIPIVINSHLAESLYSFYPCVIVDNWGQVTESRLESEYRKINEIKSFYDIRNRLSFHYWMDKIVNYTIINFNVN